MELCHATLPQCSSMFSTYAFRLALLRTSGNNEAFSFKLQVTHRSFWSGSTWQRARYNALAPVKIFSLTHNHDATLKALSPLLESSRAPDLAKLARYG